MCAAVYRQRHLVEATEVTAGLAESNGSLLQGLWRDSLHVTCGLTVCTPGSAPGPTLGNEYGKTLPFTSYVLDNNVIFVPRNSRNILVKSASFYLERFQRCGVLKTVQFWGATLY